MEPFLVRAKNKYDGEQADYTLKFDAYDIITITAEKDNLWLGTLNGGKGWLDQRSVEKVTNAFAVVNHPSADEHTDDYGIKNGDIVTVVNPYHRDWWEVQYRDKKIVYPSVFVDIIDRFRIEGKALFDYNSVDHEELSFKENDTISRIIYINNHDWFRGRVDSTSWVGLFPRNFVDFVLRPIQKATITADYVALETDELNLVSGYVIEIVEDFGNGWLAAIDGNKHGLCPVSFVQMMEDEKKSVASASTINDGPPAFVEDTKLTEQLTCSICLEYANQAVETSCCHHIFCEPCLKKVKTKVCPQCRIKNFTMVVAFLARRMIGEMEAYCTNVSCNVKTTKSELSQHLAKCAWRKFQCNLCVFSGLKNDLGLHLINNHLDETLDNCKHLFT